MNHAATDAGVGAPALSLHFAQVFFLILLRIVKLVLESIHVALGLYDVHHHQQRTRQLKQQRQRVERIHH
ncbi:hypothetical protein I1A62_37035 [Rhodococcus sp. USK10]|uniref:hypothetical protein n=1 Tax=Rhodococcus sp. USK10 TaxID=2789739 RepID=UPI001C6037B2|nr:hypothetical protein [Rhodococcus sp. USK10]QYB02740.1 hypothetical protein I1A62_37035 [Rhodococcus sp. USK10]